jgi:hypothetical protein
MRLRRRLEVLEQQVRQHADAVPRVTNAELVERARDLFQRASQPNADPDLVRRGQRLVELLQRIRQRRLKEMGGG